MMATSTKVAKISSHMPIPVHITNGTMRSFKDSSIGDDDEVSLVSLLMKDMTE